MCVGRAIPRALARPRNDKVVLERDRGRDLHGVTLERGASGELVEVPEAEGHLSGGQEEIGPDAESVHTVIGGCLS